MNYNEQIEEIKQVIESFKLKRKTNKRETVYRRNYIVARLWKMGLRPQEIGDMLGKDRSWTYSANKSHEQFKNDSLYLHHIKPIKEALRGFEVHKDANFVRVCFNGDDFIRIKKAQLKGGFLSEKDYIEHVIKQNK